jgi:hypothetical protein
MSTTLGLKFILALTGASLAMGCGIQAKHSSNERSPSGDAVGTETDKTSGGIALRMPSDKPGKKTKKLRVTLEQPVVCYDEGYSTGYEGDAGVISAPGENGAGIPPEFLEDREVEDDDSKPDYHDTDIDYGHDIAYPCESGTYAEYEFDFKEGKQIEISDLKAGGYVVHVFLLDRKGEVIEQGSSWAEVVPGENAYVTIVLGPANGGLVIDIVRWDEWTQPEPYPMPEPMPEPTPDPMPCGGGDQDVEKPLFDRDDGEEQADYHAAPGCIEPQAE